MYTVTFPRTLKLNISCPCFPSDFRTYNDLPSVTADEQGSPRSLSTLLKFFAWINIKPNLNRNSLSCVGWPAKPQVLLLFTLNGVKNYSN